MKTLAANGIVIKPPSLPTTDSSAVHVEARVFTQTLQELRPLLDGDGFPCCCWGARLGLAALIFSSRVERAFELK